MGNGGTAGLVYLYNLTDGITVGAATQIIPNTTAPAKYTQSLIPGTTTGFPNAGRLYEARISFTGSPNPTDAIFTGSVTLQIQ